MDIKLKAKLCAYSKGVYPDTTKFVTQAPDDGKLYGRKTVDGVGEWEEIVDTTSEMSQAGEGIDVSKDGRYVTISARQKTLYRNDPELENIENDTTYYVIDNTPNIFVNGGTASNDYNREHAPEGVEYTTTNYNGGDANTSEWEQLLAPVNAEGVTTLYEYNTSKIVIRQDTEANWENKDPILSSGEPGYAIGVGLKVGDGEHTWTQLQYTALTENKQSDLAETNENLTSFVRNKSTKYLVNEGEDGTSKYATIKDVENAINSAIIKTLNTEV